MSVIDHLPTTTRGRWTALVSAAVLWSAAYWLNRWLWDEVFYTLLGMPPTDRLTETLHFFFYDTVKIAVRPLRAEAAVGASSGAAEPPASPAGNGAAPTVTGIS